MPATRVIRSYIGTLLVPGLVPVLLALALCSPCAHAQTSGPRVIIDSSPPGATVYIDGKERGVQGYSSSTFKLRLSKGPHRVLLELEGYKSAEQVISVTQAQKFTFTLERAPARLDVRSPGTNESARGGEVFIDGAPAGTVPVPVEVPSGRHLIEVRKPGHRVYSENIELRAGDTRTLWVTLQSEARAGSMLISADAGADVYVDGQPRGQAPVLVDNLPEGDHLVEVRRPEANAPPWRQNVRVVAGQQLKVTAQTQPAVAQAGSLLVTSSTAEAEVLVDGVVRGRVNQEIGNLRPGQHALDVRAKGFGSVSKVVEVEGGKQRVERVELPESAEGRGVGILRVIMVNPVEGAQYYINGRKYDEAVILNEKGMEISSGHNIVVVRKENFGEARQEVNVRPGGRETVTIDLRNVGKILVTSDPRGAQVLIDKQPVGQTPYTAENVGAGPHMVELLMPDFQTYLEQVEVRGGEQKNVNAVLIRPLVGPLVDDGSRRRGLSSFSALTIDPGNFTADVGLGYPYFVDLRLTVGAARRGGFGLDAGVEFRTTFYETDVAANLRAQILKVGPIAVGANVLVGGGGGPRKRNGFVFEAGLPITLLAGNLVRLTARPYLQVYSDRLCPSVVDIQDLVAKKDDITLSSLEESEHIGDRCAGGGDVTRGIPPRYPNAIADAARPQIGDPMGRSVYEANLGNYQQGDTYVLDRFNGVRGMIQAVVEVAISNSSNVWFLIEGAPFQPDRQSYTDKFNRVFPTSDLPLYGRIGYTIKF